jgi:hypothetical protein
MKSLRVFLTTLLMILASLCCGNSAEPGWQDLFDGKSTAGWTALDGNPPGDGWQVVDGCLHLKGRGGNLLSKEEYESFELEWQWKIEKGGNNGIKYWVTHVEGREWLGIEYQMIDDGVHPDAPIGSSHATASLYDIKAAQRDKPLRPTGEWNESRIIVQNGKLQHFLNGRLVVEINTLSPEWQSCLNKSKFRNKKGFAPGKGRLMLTDHTDPVWYRKIRIRKLKDS